MSAVSILLISDDDDVLQMEKSFHVVIHFGIASYRLVCQTRVNCFFLFDVKVRCVTFSNIPFPTKIVVIRFRMLYSICRAHCTKSGDPLLRWGPYRLISQNSQVLSLRLFQSGRSMQSYCVVISNNSAQGASLYPACRAWVEDQRQVTPHHRRLSMGCAPIAGLSRSF